MAVGRLWAGGYIVREVVDCPSLEILQTQLDAYSTACCMEPVLRGEGLDSMIPSSPYSFVIL